jgi:ParB family chromosome partitioning protein
MADFIQTIAELPIADITIGDRLRPVSEATISALCQVIEEHGFTVPILVRKKRSGFVLIDGAHRLAAMQRRGAAIIPVCAVTCTDVEARALETTQNLAGASLSPLDDALFLAAYSAAYEELHPETRRGAAGAVARHGSASELNSFAEVIAEKRAVSVRQVQKIAAAGRKISRTEADLLRQAPRKVTLKDVEDIGKISDTEERSQVVLRLVGGNAKTAAQARRSLLQEAGGDGSAASEKDSHFLALMASWKRAPLAARRRFVVELQGEIEDLLEGGVSAGDEEGSDG